MENKLKLEHVAAYLPYGVKVLFLQNAYYGGHCKDSYPDKIGEFAYNKKRIGSVTGFKNGKVLSTIGFFDINKTDDTHVGPHVTHKYEKRLILRPLSDLKRDDLFKMWSDHVDYLTTEREHWIKMYGINKYVDELPYSHYKYLLKNHFDIHGLIEQGLAIDIKTLNNKPNE